MSVNSYINIYINNEVNICILFCSVCFTSLPSQSTLPWADCPLNSNRTGPLEECETATSTKYFFYRETLNISSSVEENGGVQWGQALCLLLAWAITYLLISKGIKSTGKVRQL